MAEIIDKKDDIIDWLFFINLISLFIGFFMFSRTLFIIIMFINIVLDGTFIIMSKWGDKFMTQHNIKYGEKDGAI